jgi:hypothetical protein
MGTPCPDNAVGRLTAEERHLYVKTKISNSTKIKYK